MRMPIEFRIAGALLVIFSAIMHPIMAARAVRCYWLKARDLARLEKNARDERIDRLRNPSRYPKQEIDLDR